MKKLKGMFKTIIMQILSQVNLGQWRLELNKQVFNFVNLKSLSFILWWERPFLKQVKFSKYFDLYQSNASGTCKTCLQKPFSIGELKM